MYPLKNDMIKVLYVNDRNLYVNVKEKRPGKEKYQNAPGKRDKSWFGV